MELRQSFIKVSLLRMHVTYWAPVYQLTIIIGNFRWKIPITTLPFVCWRDIAWWRHQMKTFSASLTLCAGSWPLICEFPYKGQWRGALMFFICTWTNGWGNTRNAHGLIRHRAYYDCRLNDHHISTLKYHKALTSFALQGKDLPILHN